MWFLLRKPKLEIVILSEVIQTKKDKYHRISLVCGFFLNGTNELIYKTETELQSQNYQGGKGEGIN